MQKKIFITKNAEETQKLGEEFVKKLKGGEVIALYGELGAGKTTFVQGLAKGLGIKKRIISPTFIIIRRYELRIKNYELGIRYFYHIDLYRVQSMDDIKGLGIEEILNNPNNVVVIEWAEKMEEMLPIKRIEIYFEYLNDNQRKIFIKN